MGEAGLVLRRLREIARSATPRSGAADLKKAIGSQEGMQGGEHVPDLPRPGTVPMFGARDFLNAVADVPGTSSGPTWAVITTLISPRVSTSWTALRPVEKHIAGSNFPHRTTIRAAPIARNLFRR